VNSLLERLRRRLREVGRPPREGPASDDGRHSSRADAGDPPQRRTELEPTSGRKAPDRTCSAEEARLPVQQPPPPKSTRLKVAVFSKKRQPGPQRQAGALWGPTSFLGVVTAAPGGIRTDHSPLTLLEAGFSSTNSESSTDMPSWPPRTSEPSAQTFALSVAPTADPVRSQFLLWEGQPALDLFATVPIVGAPDLASAANAMEPLVDMSFSGLRANPDTK
jgi:hypothetical protein